MVLLDRELESARQGALVVPNARATLRVTGKDRLSWLNGLVTQDLAPRKVGDVALALVVAKTGKIEAEIAVVVADDELLVALPEGRAERIVEKLDRHLIMEDAALELLPERAWTLVFGPRAAEALSVARARGGVGGLTTRGGVDVAVVVAPASVDVASAVLAAVDPSARASDEGWLRFRVEHGIAERGVDYTDDESYPQEAALEKDAVSFAKGCYLGQEAVFMLEKRGHVSKRLVQLVSQVPLERGAEVRDRDGKPIGAVTSSVATGEGGLSLGVVKYKHARADHELAVALANGVVPARVTALLAITPEP